MLKRQLIALDPDTLTKEELKRVIMARDAEAINEHMLHIKITIDNAVKMAEHYMNTIDGYRYPTDGDIAIFKSLPTGALIRMFQDPSTPLGLLCTIVLYASAWYTSLLEVFCNRMMQEMTEELKSIGGLELEDTKNDQNET